MHPTAARTGDRRERPSRAPAQRRPTAVIAGGPARAYWPAQHPAPRACLASSGAAPPDRGDRRRSRTSLLAGAAPRAARVTVRPARRNPSGRAPGGSSEADPPRDPASHGPRPPPPIMIPFADDSGHDACAGARAHGVGRRPARSPPSADRAPSGPAPACRRPFCARRRRVACRPAAAGPALAAPARRRPRGARARRAAAGRCAPRLGLARGASGVARRIG